MKHHTTILLALTLSTLACDPGPRPWADAGVSPVEDMEPTEEEPEADPVAECCECLLDATDPVGEPCADSWDQCVTDLDEGRLPGPARCGVGGEPYCSEFCGEVWPG